MTLTCKLGVAVLSVLSTQNPALSQPQYREHLPNQIKATSAFTQSTWLNINRIKIDLNNGGGLDNSHWGEAAFWPDTPRGNIDAAAIVFDCGPWVVGKYNGVPSIGCSQWRSTYSPGPAINGQAAMIADPADALRYRLYRIERGDNSENNPDYSDWPADLGAPVDAQGKPHLYGDQTVWTVYNNLDTSVYINFSGRVPHLPVVIQQTAYAHAVVGEDTSALLANVMLLEWTIINAGNAPIESTYVSLWTDIDFTEMSFSNIPAVDTTVQLGYCWQSRDYPFDDPYVPPRAVGFVWLYGPTVASPGDVAIFRGRARNNARNLPLSSFWDIPDDSYGDAAPYGPAYSMTSAWNIARGFDKQGNPIIDSVTHQVTKFPYSGDPVTGSGWVSGQNLIGGGSGFNLFSGPFTLAPCDTQWMMAALIPSTAADRLACVTLLRQYAAMLRSMSYDEFTVTSAPERPPTTPLQPLLYQNYPNPFNPSTTIRYALSSRAHVLLTVFNALGQRVATLDDGMEDPGDHSVRFDASGLSSGVYFYRMTAGGYVATRKLIIADYCLTPESCVFNRDGLIPPANGGAQVPPPQVRTQGCTPQASARS